MEAGRHVRLFRNGRNQAIRIPKELELEGEEAIIRKEDGHLVIEPVQKKDLLTVLEGLETLDEPFPDVDEGLGAPEDVDLE
jgi:antitoxin VapB